MKNNKIKTILIVCMLVSALALALTACNNEVVFTIDDFTAIVSADNQPYDFVVKTQSGELNDWLHMQIGKDGDKIIAVTNYTEQEYNKLATGTEEKIKTESGTEYFDGARQGTLVGDSVIWEESEFTLPKIPKLTLTADFFEGNYAISMQSNIATLSAGIKAEKGEEIFGKKGMSNIKLSISVETTSRKVTEIKVTYLRHGISSSVTTTYGYDLQSVVIPTK
ncbi:MAG: hypothetical protein RR405_04825 [Clostridia bacterium]